MRRGVILITIVFILTGIAGWFVVRALTPSAHLAFESRALPAAPVPAVEQAAAVWTGREFVVFGGAPSGSGIDRVDGTESAQVLGEEEDANAAGPGDKVSNRGAAFDPATGTWRKIAPAPITPRVRHTAVWTGNEVLVWGGTDRPHGVGGLRDGAAYNPSTDSWRVIVEAPPGTDRSLGQAVTVDGMVLIGAGSGPTMDADRTILVYDIADDHWAVIDAPNQVIQLSPAGDGVAVLWSDPMTSTYEIGRLDLSTGEVEPGIQLDFEFQLTSGGLVGGPDRLLFVADQPDDNTSIYDIDLDQRRAVELPTSRTHLEGPVDIWGMGDLRPVLQDATGHLLIPTRHGRIFGLDPTTGDILGMRTNIPGLCTNGGATATDGTRLFTWGGTTCRAGDSSTLGGTLLTVTWPEPQP